MMRCATTILLTFLFVLVSQRAFACEQLVEVPEPRIDELVAVLKDTTASEIKYLRAFAELSCSKDPAIRRYVVDMGLASTSKVIRGQALATLLMQRDQIRLEIMGDAKGDEATTQWIHQNGRDINYRFHYRSREHNCISLSVDSAKKCPGLDQMITIDGTGIRMVYSHLSGEFTLQPDGSLRGTIVVTKGKPLPAKIELRRS